MKRIILIGWITLITGCGSLITDNDSYDPPTPGLEEVWVCHNPQSELHGTACKAEVDIYRGHHQPCFWVNRKRSKTSFCWHLKKGDCEGEPEWDWQRNNCHLLAGDMVK